MQITILDLKSKDDLKEEEAYKLLLSKYKMLKGAISSYKLVKKSLDCRDKNYPIYVYQFVLETNKRLYLHDKKVLLDTKYTDEINVNRLNRQIRPIIIGSGPSGLFAAYMLVKAGFKPLIFERGASVIERIKAIDSFFKDDLFDETTNVSFGEGGAGTFSDGKLNTNLNDPRIRFILKTFVDFGAKENVYYDAKPHVGTDYLRLFCQNMRTYLINEGAEFKFKTLVSDVREGYIVANGDKYESKIIILAIGHSARDTYQMLEKNGFKLEPKPFSMGVRIEHLQKKIDYMQYGNAHIHDPASYKAAVHLADRDVYTFCMCPGGYVVASNSNANEIVTNGMSYEARDGVNANSALLVNVRVEDFYKESPLDGLAFQAKYEKACYELTNSYKAPVNLVKEFLIDQVSSEFRSVKPTYPKGFIFTSFKDLLPNFVITSLKKGIIELNQKMPGFLDDDAILTAIESRSSSPVRIVRDSNFETNLKGVYAIGEGAGYAGGITSSALDGIKCALKIIERIDK